MGGGSERWLGTVELLSYEVFRGKSLWERLADSFKEHTW